MGWWMMGLGWLLALLAGGGILWLLLSAARRNGGMGPGPGPRGQQDTPEQIAKRRYAQGELDRDTYERMLEDLRR